MSAKISHELPVAARMLDTSFAFREILNIIFVSDFNMLITLNCFLGVQSYYIYAFFFSTFIFTGQTLIAATLSLLQFYPATKFVIIIIIIIHYHSLYSNAWNCAPLCERK